MKTNSYPSYYLENNEIFSADKRRFTGIWIPHDLFFCKTLSWGEKILIKNIESLCSAPKGCFASDSYFAETLHLSLSSIRRHLIRLRKLKIIKTVSFNGRKRRIAVDRGQLDTFLLNSFKNELAENSKKHIAVDRGLLDKSLSNSLKTEQAASSKRACCKLKKSYYNNKYINISSISKDIHTKRKRFDNENISVVLKNRKKETEEAPEFKKKTEGAPEFKKKTEISEFTKKIIKRWNKYTPLIVRHGTDNKISLRIQFAIKSFLRGEFAKTHALNSTWLSTNKIPESLARQKFTKEKILKTIKRLHLYHKEGYEPQNKSFLSRSLLNMIYNPRTGTSWFMKAASSKPQKLRENFNITIKDKHPEITEGYLKWITKEFKLPENKENSQRIIYPAKKFVEFWKTKLSDEKFGNKCRDDFSTPERMLRFFVQWLEEERWIMKIISNSNDKISSATHFLGSPKIIRKFVEYHERVNLQCPGRLLGAITKDFNKQDVGAKERVKTKRWAEKQIEEELEELI